MGPLHAAQARGSTAAGPPRWSPRSSTTSTSCCASASDGGPLDQRAAADHRRASPPSSRRDTADITDRQNIQLHWIRVEDVPEIWRAARGASAWAPPRPAATRPRVILGSPVAGIAADEIIDGTPAIGEIHRPLHRRPGVLQPAAQVQDRRSRGSPAARRGARDQRHLVRRGRAPRARPRLRRVGRRRAVDQPDAGAAARRLGVARARSPRSGRASSAIFRDYGYRRLRNRARLKFLMADWGPEKFREILETEYLKRPCSTARRPTSAAARARPRRRARAAGRRFYVGVAPTVGPRRAARSCTPSPSSPRRSAAAGSG